MQVAEWTVQQVKLKELDRAIFDSDSWTKRMNSIDSCSYSWKGAVRDHSEVRAEERTRMIRMARVVMELIEIEQKRDQGVSVGNRQSREIRMSLKSNPERGGHRRVVMLVERTTMIFAIEQGAVEESNRL